MRRSPILAITLCALVSGAVACGDSTGPSNGGPIDTTPRIDVSSTQLAQSQLVVGDVSLRLIPSIGNAPGTLELAASVSSVSQAVVARDAESLIGALARARTALSQVRAQTGVADAADLDAIELAFRDAELLITFPS